MGKISSFLTKWAEKRGLLDHPEQWTRYFTNLDTKAGIYITPKTAFQTSVVYACVRVLAESIASLPKHIYVNRSDGGKDIDKTHILYPIIHDSPNQWQTSYEFFELLIGHLSLLGNAYSYITRNRSGTILSLIPLDPNRIILEIKPGSTYDNPQIIYRYKPTINESEIIFSPYEIWHLKGLSQNGFEGISPIMAAKEAIGLAQAAEGHGSRFFKQGALPGGIAKIPGRLKPDAHERLKSDLQGAMAGESAFKVVVLEGGLDWQTIGIPMRDSQFLQTRQFQVEDIARIFRVPCVLIGHADKTSTYASAEQFFISFVTHTLRPWLVRLEQSINKYLFPEQDKGKYFCEFKVDGLMRGDTKSRYEAYALAIQNTWMSVNEVRALENLNPIADGDSHQNPAITPGNNNQNTNQEENQNAITET